MAKTHLIQRSHQVVRIHVQSLAHVVARDRGKFGIFTLFQVNDEGDFLKQYRLSKHCMIYFRSCSSPELEVDSPPPPPTLRHDVSPTSTSLFQVSFTHLK